MKFIITDNKNKVIKEIKSYPNISMGDEIIGFDYSKFKIYVIVEDARPAYNENGEYLKKTEEFTDIIYPASHQIRTCYVRWQVLSDSEEIVIEKLNESLGIHLDQQYPMWERTKHAGEGNYILWAKTEDGLSAEQIARKTYIDNTYAWITQCRAERDTREANYINNGVIPSFVWDVRP